MSEKFNVKAEILAAIAKTSDEHLKLILLLLLGVLEEISGKIDLVATDEKAIKAMALNGHEANHHIHHDWIEQRMRHNGRCDWANREIEKQLELAATKKSLTMKFAEGLLQQLSIIIITALAVSAGFMFLT